MSSREMTGQDYCPVQFDVAEFCTQSQRHSETRIQNYFPRPYPDELIYSVIARFARNSGITTKIGSGSTILFGEKGLIPVVPLPRRLEHLASLLPPELQLDAEILLNDHTLYNYMFAFETTNRQQEARRAMMDPSPGAKALRVGQMMPFLDRLRYCPQCNDESVGNDVIGDMYWHRKHQLPGIDICVSHRRPLCVSELRVGSVLAGFNYRAATKLVCPSAPCSLACPDDAGLIDEQGEIGTTAFEFLSASTTRSADFTGSSYMAKLKASGMQTEGRGWRKTALESLMTKWPRMFDRHPNLRDVPVWLFDILNADKIRNSVILQSMVHIWASDPPVPKAAVTGHQGRQPSRGCAKPSTANVVDDLAIEKAIHDAARSIQNAYPHQRVTKSSLARETGIPQLVRSRGLGALPRSSHAIEQEVETLEHYLTRCGYDECERMQRANLPILHSKLAQRLRIPRDRTANELLRKVAKDFLERSRTDLRVT